MNSNYESILKSLKEQIRYARQKASIAVNEQLLGLYWDIGNTILEQQSAEGWGTKVIKRLADDLRSEFPDMKGLSERNLKYMRSFAEAYPNGIVQVVLAQPPAGSDSAIVQAPLAQLTWYHHLTLLEKVKDEKTRLFYIDKTVENGWSRNIMLTQIESELHKRQGAAITNFQSTLTPFQSDLATETIKSPYVFDFLSLGDQIREKDFENALISNMKQFLLELGKGFAYVGNQYNLVVDDTDFFLDLLFYNTRLHCYVVFELKVGEFKPEFAGKLNFYVNTIDAQIKTERDEPTIGVLLCKTPNRTVIEYSLKGVEKPLGVANYQLSKALPENLKADLPTVEELEHELEKEIEIPKSPIEERLRLIKEKVAKLGKAQIKEPQSPEAIRRIVDKFLYPLWDSYKLKSTELSRMFKFDRSTLGHVGHGFYKKEEFEKKLQDSPNPYEIRVRLSLDGFISAGTEAFQVSKELTIRFLELKYQIFYASDDRPEVELLYHQVPSNDEIEMWSDKLIEALALNVEERLDNMNATD